MNNKIKKRTCRFMLLLSSGILLSMAVTAQTTAATGFGFGQSFLAKKIDSKLFAPQASATPRISILRLQPAVSVPERNNEAQNNAIWHAYYKKHLGKGIGLTTAGAASLAAGIGLVTVGVLELTGVIGGTYGTNNTYSADNFLATSPPQWSNNTTQVVNPNVNAGVTLLSAGAVLIPVGIILLPIGTKTLRTAAHIKSEAGQHDITVSVAPKFNPVTNNYAFNLKLKF